LPVASDQYLVISNRYSVSRSAPAQPADHWKLNTDYSRTTGIDWRSLNTDHGLLNGDYPRRLATLDPENRLLSHFPRRRLEAEAIRDSILYVSGGLDLKMGGSLLTVSNRAYVTSTASKLDSALFVQPLRSVYLPVIRSALYNVFQIFDFADPSTLNGHRDQTTVAPQALFMMNSKLVADASRRLADTLLAYSAGEGGTSVLASQSPSTHGSAGASLHQPLPRDYLLAGNLRDDSARLEKLYRTALSRSPTEPERTAALKYLDRYAAKSADRGVSSETSRVNAWQSLARVVLASNEFIYVE